MTTRFCELAAYYLDLAETEGLDAAGESASESMMSHYECDDDLSDSPSYEIGAYLAQQLSLMHEVEEIACGIHPWCPNWLDNISALHTDEPETIAEPDPTESNGAIATFRAHLKAERRWLCGWIANCGFQNSIRYALKTRKFWRWEVTDINGDRHEVTTQEPLTLKQAREDISPHYAIHRLTAIATDATNPYKAE